MLYYLKLKKNIMSLAHSLIIELEHEVASTQKILACVPAEKFDWKPHAKSMSLKQLSAHVANLTSWTDIIINSDYLDFAEGKFQQPTINSTQDLLNELQAGAQKSIAALKSVKEEDLIQKEWILKNGDTILLKLTKIGFIRSMALNHLYHHRGQLSVYLRLLDVAIPGMYGPSADEMSKA